MSNIDYKQLSKQFSDAIGTFGGNRAFGTSFMDQYRNANLGLQSLDGVTANDNLSQGQIDGLRSAAKGMKGSAIAGGVMAGVTGATQILSNALQAGQIQDTTQLHNQINDLGQIGAYNYNNFDQLANDYSMMSITPDISYDSIRGMNTGQKIANVGSSMMSGAAAGMQIGGPWGAAVGAVVGAGGSLAGILSGDKKAHIEEDFLNAQADMASSMAQNNLQAAHERISNNMNRQGAVHVVAKGGKIERKGQSVKDYANKVLAKPRQRSMECGGRITRSKACGGTMVRIRVK